MTGQEGEWITVLSRVLPAQAAARSGLCPVRGAFAAAGGLPEISRKDRPFYFHHLIESHHGLPMAEQPLHTDDSFPAMTPAQRLYFEVNGYVVIENVTFGGRVRGAAGRPGGASRPLRGGGEPRRSGDRRRPRRVLEAAALLLLGPPSHGAPGVLPLPHPPPARRPRRGGGRRQGAARRVRGHRQPPPPGLRPRGPRSATSGIAAASPASTATPTAASTTAPSSRP